MTIQIDIDINIIAGIPNTMVITTQTNHTVKIHTIEHITIDTTIGQRSMKWKSLVSAAPDCTDLSDCEGQVNNETTDNTKN